MTAATLTRRREQRAVNEIRDMVLGRIELRADTVKQSLTLDGYACVTASGYEMYGGPTDGGWTEYVDQGAFTKTLREAPDVQLVVNHGGMPLARTKSGTLALNEDPTGLHVLADLSLKSQTVQELQIAMDRGDMDEMSFKFRVLRDKWITADGEEVPWWDLAGIDRHIVEVSLHKGDVSMVNYGANPATSAQLRGLDAAFGALRVGRPLTGEQRHMILVAMGDIEIDESWVTDQGVDNSTETETETETETAPAADQTPMGSQSNARRGLSLTMARAMAT